jgi:hypothetical protein
MFSVIQYLYMYTVRVVMCHVAALLIASCSVPPVVGALHLCVYRAFLSGSSMLS